MNCPRCDAQLSFQKRRCENCGQDLKRFRQVYGLANSFYNEGLQRAQIRDLSGAVSSLTTCLKLYKQHMQARNLLGLIYYEEGEIVSGLREWIISKHFHPDNNEADYYISQVQANPNKLENYNQTIKKYNFALSSALTGDEDMAIIQLRKVVGMNPHFVRAHQLLALLYMQTGKKENRVKAYKLLKNISTVDINNTTTLRYLKELSDVKVKREKLLTPKADNTAQANIPKVDTDAYKPITLYKEEKPFIMPFLQILLGVVIGVVLMRFLILPQMIKNANEATNANFKQYSEKLATEDSDTSTLKNENTNLKKQVEKLQGQLEASQSSANTEDYDNLLDAYQYSVAGDVTAMAESLAKIKDGSFTTRISKKLYKKLTKSVSSDASTTYFEQGRDCYNGEGAYVGKQDYDEAITLLLKSLDYDETNTDAMYFLGRCYQRKGDNDKAKEYYDQIINDYPDSERVAEAQARLKEMGM